ncbi:MAG TPA: fused MFS/spermidine synthase [Anaerolineae bacterium]|nr:fused MFS/spermidine synthase [Anaerolineae bacterium]HQJ50395.1 fused MFS/spermidine synthase [Anaerolineae bacterium]
MDQRRLSWSVRKPASERRSKFSLPLLVVTVGGLATMGTEMCASRLLAPYFGNSLPVWGVLIGLLLACLAVGSVLGGRLADRSPDEALLYQLAGWAGLAIGIIPYVARPVLGSVSSGLTSAPVLAIVGAFGGVLALFTVPMVLLGCLSPFVLRLSLREVGSGGDVAGRISALGTLGSLLGTFGAVFVLIPGIGTRRSMVLLGLLVALVALLGLRRLGSRWAVLWLLVCLALTGLILLPSGSIKPNSGLLYEHESMYNYVQVLREGDQILLKLNEGEGIQSVYEPGQVLSGYVYDYFLLVPYFQSRPESPPGQSVCIVGLAGGTSARLFSEVFGPLPIDGVEIDATVVEAGRRFMDLNLPNLQITIMDGRQYLAATPKRYDVVLLDAYNPPYIPFHLTTREFFALVYEHQTEDGVLGINVAHLENDSTLVRAIAATVGSVYPSVYVIDTQSGLNSVVVASHQKTEWSEVSARLSSLTAAALRQVIQRAEGRIKPFTARRERILTDDQAPVEQLVHAMLARYLSNPVPSEVNP